MKKIAIATLGCKVNQYDSAVIRESLGDAEYNFVPFSRKADIYIINTCTVTKKADYQSRQLIRRSHRLNPCARIIVTGCYAQRAPQEIKEIPGVDHTVAVGDVRRIISLIDTPPRREPPPIITGNAATFPEKTRAFLKVQDGCNSRCSYCIIPYTRGRSKSCGPEETIKRILRLVAFGYREIVLTGIHLGSYGWDLKPRTTLANLIKSIENQGISTRIRLSSIEPTEFTDDLIDVIVSSAIVCNHLHIPLQSGDNEILKRMRRPYDRLFFKELVERLVSAIPDLNIGVDVIAGFPGETEESFKNTVDLIEGVPTCYLHVFPYSRRPGTPAADFPDQVGSKTIRERSKILRRLGNRKRQDYYTRFLGKRLSILVEAKRDVSTGRLKGFSRNYIPVLVNGWDNMVNREIRIKVTKVQEGNVFGALESG